MEGLSRNISPVFKQYTPDKKSPLQITPVGAANLTQTPDVAELQVKKSKKRKRILIGAAVTTMLGAYAAVFYRKNIANFASKIVKKVYLKTETYKEHGHSSLDMMSLGVARALDKMLSSTQLFVNFSAMKDSISNRVARALKMGPLCDKLSSTWEKLATKAVKANYNACDKSFDKTSSDIATIVQNLRKNADIDKIVQVDGKNYKLGHLIKLIETNMHDARQLYKKGFSNDAFDARNSFIKERLQAVNEEFCRKYTSFKYYKDFEFTRFTAEEMLAPVKMSYQNHLMVSKAEISNNIDDKFIATIQLLRSFDNMIATKDAKSRKVLKEIFSKLKDYRNLSGANEKASRQVLTEDIQKQLQILMKELSKNPKYEDASLKKMSGLVDEIHRTLNMSKKGKLQETLTYLKAVLPKEEYRKIRSQVYHTSDKLNQVVQGEGDLYFDKLRDIVLGSAFSDIIFGMVTPLATMGAVLALDETKEERISTTLRLGIPLIGGIATSTAFLFLLASGGKALILSSLIGLGLNRIGTYADNRLVQDRMAKEDKHPKANAVIKNVNLASTILSTDPTSLVVDKAINKGVNESFRFANSQLNKIREASNSQEPVA